MLTLLAFLTAALFMVFPTLAVLFFSPLQHKIPTWLHRYEAWMVPENTSRHPMQRVNTYFFKATAKRDLRVMSQVHNKLIELPEEPFAVFLQFAVPMMRIEGMVKDRLRFGFRECVLLAKRHTRHFTARYVICYVEEGTIRQCLNFYKKEKALDTLREWYDAQCYVYDRWTTAKIH